MTRRHTLPIAVVATTLLANSLPAQSTPATSETASDNELIRLSPFSVESSRDYGYRASNSIAATRTNTPIKDVPVNIAVFTKDLYDDLNITNQVELERYNASLVNGGSDIRSDNPIQQAYNAFLFRGFVQNWGLRDGIRQYDPVDTQGLARVEVVKGPVAALYGLSYAGGVMNNITKEVDFNKNFTSIRLTAQSEGQYRAALDANFAGKVAGGQFGVRFNAANTQTADERAHSDGQIQHAQVNLNWKPTSTTELRFLGETGSREKPNGLGYFSRGETNSAGVSLGNNSDIPLQIFHPEIPWDWNWSNGLNKRSLDTKLYRGTAIQQIGDDFTISGYLQYSTRQQIDGNGWDANGSGGADSWEAGGGWLGNVGAADERIEAGYSYRDWSNDMHAYGTTAVYKLDLGEVKNTFTFGANVWQEKFVSRAGNQNAAGASAIHVAYAVKAGIPINVPYAPPTDFRPMTDGNGWTHENNSNDYYFASWQGSFFKDSLKLNAAVNRTNLKLVQWANGLDVNPKTTKVSKNSPMFGGVYEVTKGISLFAVHGTSLFPSTDKNSFGTQMPPEVGKSLEGGVKFEVLDGKLSGTASYYKIKREGGGKNVTPHENRDTQIWDSLSAADRALRYPNKTRGDLLNQGDFVPAGELESKGYELDLVYQATRNWQIMASYAHNSNEAVSSPVASDLGKSTSGSIKNQFALVNKYTFADGPVKGLSLGAGLQYAGKALQDYNGPGGSARYNPSTNWLEVFGSYRFKMFGYNSVVQLNVKNLTKQEEYVGWKATGSSSIIATQRYEVPTEIRYALTLGIDL